MRTINGDERNLLFAGKRSRHRGFSGARRTDQQNASRRREANLLVDLVVHVRMLEDGVEQSFHFGQAAEVCKSRGAFFNEKFASGAGLDFL